MPVASFASTPFTRRLNNRVAVAWRPHTQAMRNRRPIVTFTLDDCPKSAVTAGAVLLSDHGVAGTFYLSGGLAGRNWENGAQFDLADVRALLERRHEVGCHTFSHLDCATASSAQLQQELALNKAFLERVAPGHVSETFAYPYGRVGLGAKREIQRHFLTCRGVEAGINHDHADFGLLKAVGIPSTATDGRWLKPWLDQVVATCGWLILYTHDIAPDPTPFGCTPAVFASTIAQIQSAGIDVLTMREAARAVAALPAADSDRLLNLPRIAGVERSS